jgi:hypothetical protein
MVGLIWTGVLVGFGWDVIDHVGKHRPNWPIMVHLHSVVMVAWLVLLTTQVLFIRSGRVDLHKKLGIAGAAWAVVVVLVGLANSVFMDRHHLGTPQADPAFLSIQLNDLILFTGLVGSALLMRNRDPSAHKRLMLMSTLQIADAGFARWMLFVFPALAGPDFWPNFISFWAPTDGLVLGLGFYDLVTRRRLHPAYIIGALAMFASQLSWSWLYLTPAWKPVALRLIGG